MATGVVALPRRASRKRSVIPMRTASISAATFERLTVIQQIKRSFLPGARLAAFIGLLLGGFIPVATYTVAHFEVATTPALWLLVAGGMVYSAVTVYNWAHDAFGSTAKALGYCVLLEGVLVFGTVPALSLAALAVLVFINAVAAACALQIRKDATERRRAYNSNLTTIWQQG